MRDIRNDLRERLSALRRERDELQTQLTAKLAEVDAHEKAISSLLQLEEQRGHANGDDPSKPIVLPKDPEKRNDFEEAILRLLANHRTWNHADMRRCLEGDAWETTNGASLGRILQGTLLSLLGRELIEHPQKGKWRITNMGMNAIHPQTKTGANGPGSRVSN